MRRAVVWLLISKNTHAADIRAAVAQRLLCFYEPNTQETQGNLGDAQGTDEKPKNGLASSSSTDPKVPFYELFAAFLRGGTSVSRDDWS